MSWRTGCDSLRRNPMTAIVQRPGREVVALETRVRLALADPRGGVGNSSRLRSRRRGARANRARPTPWVPEGRTRGRRTPGEAATNEAAVLAHALAIQPGQDAAPSTPRWLKEWERPRRKWERCRCKSGLRPWTRSSTDRAPRP